MIDATITNVGLRTPSTKVVAPPTYPSSSGVANSANQAMLIADTLDNGSTSVTTGTIKGQPDITPTGFDVNSPPTDFLAIIANLQQILADSGSAQLQSRLALSQDIAATHAGNISEALAAVEQAKRELLKANGNAQNRTGELEQAKAELADRTNQLSNAQGKFDFAQTQLESIATELKKFPDDASVAEKYQQQLVLVDGYRDALVIAQNQHVAASSAFNDAGNAALAAVEAAIQAQTQLTAATNDLITISAQPASAVTTPDEVKTALQVLYECIARLNDIFSKSNEERLGANLRLFQERQDLLHKECMKASEDYQTAVSQSETKRGNAKLVGKIFGWIGVGVAAIAAAGTGGALAGLVALASVAVMATDQGLEAQGKQTLSGMFIDPAMNKIMGAMLEVVKTCNPDMDDAMAQAIALVLTIVVIAVASYGTAKAAGALIGRASATSPAFRATIERFNNMALFKPNPGTAYMVTKSTQIIGMTTHGIDTAVQAKMGAELGRIQQHSKEMQATLTDNNAIIAVIKRMLEEVVDGYVSGTPTYELFQQYADWVNANRSSIHQTSNARIV